MTARQQRDPLVGIAVEREAWVCACPFIACEHPSTVEQCRGCGMVAPSAEAFAAKGASRSREQAAREVAP